MFLFCSSQQDCLNPINHQRLCVLFSSSSAQSNNAPNACVSPWYENTHTRTHTICVNVASMFLSSGCGQDRHDGVLWKEWPLAGRFLRAILFQVINSNNADIFNLPSCMSCCRNPHLKSNFSFCVCDHPGPPTSVPACSVRPPWCTTSGGSSTAAAAFRSYWRSWTPRYPGTSTPSSTTPGAASANRSVTKTGVAISPSQ